MLRNDLITALSGHDNDVVYARVGAELIEVKAVTDDGGHIVVVLDPRMLDGALTLGAAGTRQYGDLTLYRTHAPSMSTRELSRIFATHRDNDARVNVEGHVVPVCGATYYSGEDAVIIDVNPSHARRLLAILVDDAMAEAGVTVEDRAE